MSCLFEVLEHALPVLATFRDRFYEFFGNVDCIGPTVHAVGQIVGGMEVVFDTDTTRFSTLEGGLAKRSFENRQTFEFHISYYSIITRHNATKILYLKELYQTLDGIEFEGVGVKWPTNPVLHPVTRRRYI